MPELKSSQIEAFLKAPDPKTPIVLFYGPDRGLSTERASRLADLLARNDTESILRLNGDALVSEPDRLVEEAHAQNLFAPIRVIRVRDGVQSLLPAVKPLLAAPPTDLYVLIEAGDLKRGAPLRKAIEASSCGVSIGSYADDTRQIGALVDAMMKDAGRTISAEARALLIEHLGSDHAVSRSEIGKLLTYVGDTGNVTEDDIVAICGDSAATQFDMLTDAVCAGHPDHALDHFRRLQNAGTDLSPTIGALIRHFSVLHRINALTADGRALADAIRGIRPPLHFRTQDAIRIHVRRWTRTGIETALHLLREALLGSRQDPDLAPAATVRTVLQLAEMARRAGEKSRTG